MKTCAVAGLCLLLLCSLAFAGGCGPDSVSPAAAAANEERRIVDAVPDGIVSISNTAGMIEVHGWSREQVEVFADLGRNVEELVVERNGNEVVVRVKLPRRSSSGGSDLVVNVPRLSTVKANGVSADIEVRDVQGPLRLNSVSGDIEADVFGADVDAESVSGDVELSGNGRDSRVQAHSVSGDVEVSGLGGEIEAGSVSGDLLIVNGAFGVAKLNTTNGDITFHAGLRDDGRMDIETINGEVDIEFQGRVSARFDIETFNGDIRNCFGPKAGRTSRYAPGHELVFTEGGGDGRVTISTLNGDLRLCRD